MLGHRYEPGMGLGKNNDGVANLVEIKENCKKFWLDYKPTRANMRKRVLEKRNRGLGLQLRPQVREAPPCHINKSFVSVGLRHEEKVAIIHDETSQKHPNWVQPCLPNFQLGNWQVVEQPKVSMAGIM